jgi:hypothetical protein
MEEVFINSLSEEGELEVSKIGTNYCKLEGWRYKHSISGGEIQSTLIDYKFDCY